MKKYLDQLPKDPWGNPYLYLNPGNNAEIDIYTLGRDGRPGGEGEDADGVATPEARSLASGLPPGHGLRSTATRNAIRAERVLPAEFSPHLAARAASNPGSRATPSHEVFKNQ